MASGQRSSAPPSSAPLSSSRTAAVKAGPASGFFLPHVGAGPTSSPWAASPAILAELAAGALFLVAVVRMGWVSDDAFITIRSVDHFLAGKGFSVHPDMRVQAFTSPAWALLCLPFLAATGSPYAALVLPCLCCALGLVVVLRRGLRDAPGQAALVFLALSTSSAFVSFSTSGLENALAHLLLAGFCLQRRKNEGRSAAAVFWLGAGLFLTRVDWAFLLLPSLAWCTARDVRRAFRKALLPAGAVLAWLGLATWYYGFPLPNTAYAKLNVELPLASQLGRGVEYLLDSAARDPIVSIVMLCSSLLVLRRGVAWSVRALQGGAMLYVVYVVAIGGDFMSGRFLTGSYLVSVLVAVELLAPAVQAAPRTQGLLAVPLVLLLVPQLQGRPADQRSADCRVGATGIVDERDCYVDSTGLGQNLSVAKWKTHGYLAELRKVSKKTKGDVVVFDLVGLAGYGTDRPLHIVERFALTDPLLARIRVEPKGRWRAGHFSRELPEGYLESLRRGRNLVRDPCLRRLHGDLTQVTRGPLWSWERMKAIARLNTSSSTCRSS